MAKFYFLCNTFSLSKSSSTTFWSSGYLSWIVFGISWIVSTDSTTSISSSVSSWRKSCVWTLTSPGSSADVTAASSSPGDDSGGVTSSLCSLVLSLIGNSSADSNLDPSVSPVCASFSWSTVTWSVESWSEIDAGSLSSVFSSDKNN